MTPEQLIGYAAFDNYQKAVDQAAYETMFHCAEIIDVTEISNITEFDVAKAMANNPNIHNLIINHLQSIALLFTKPVMRVQQDVLVSMNKVDVSEIINVQHMKRTNMLN